MKIGIGITTRNRYNIFKNTLAEIQKHCLNNTPGRNVTFKMIVVDDASEIPCPEATYRFEKNVGIARAKNMCFELLEDCDHIFLFDDDCYPISYQWWEPYIDSPEKHLCYIFCDLINGKSLGDCEKIYADSKITAYSHARGCMLYYDREVLYAVGGMDKEYKRWGYEHVDLSNRIFNAGLTTFRYMDVAGSNKLIHSLDEQMTVVTSVPISERINYLNDLREHFKVSFSSTKFCPYKKTTRKVVTNWNANNIILTSYFTGFKDLQRGTVWQSDPRVLNPLIESCRIHNQKLVVLTNSFGDNELLKSVSLINTEATTNPYFQRWISQYQYLAKHIEIDNVWLVDATDVELLKNPFETIYADTIMVGYEPKFVDSEWMRVNFNNKIYADLYAKYGKKTLLNCGLIGGTRKNVMEFIHDMLGFYSDNFGKLGPFEMGMFNQVAFTKWSGRIEFGPHINTEFKKFEKNNKVAIWRHK